MKPGFKISLKRRFRIWRRRVKQTPKRAISFQRLVRHSKKNKTVKLISRCYSNGSIEHYYHYLLDFALPFALLLEKIPNNVNFEIQEHGILTPINHEIFGERLTILTDENRGKGVAHELVGMDITQVYVRRSHIEVLKQWVFERLNINHDNPNKILLIERDAPNDFFLKKAKKKGSGTSRRSIVNHHELANAINNEIHPAYEFCNIKLENMSFLEQVQYFSSSAMIIGQHGAGLVNMIWMNKDGVVAEIGFEDRAHFLLLAKKMKYHFLIQQYEESHVNIDCQSFLNWLRSDKKTRKFFKEE